MQSKYEYRSNSREIVIQNGIDINRIKLSYPLTPFEGAPFPHADSEEITTISDVVELLNDEGQQRSGLRALGVTADGSVLKIQFTERGKAYADPVNDRSKTEAGESEASFSFEIHLPRRVPRVLPLTVELGGWVQENVNFLGHVIVKGAKGDFCLPLTGRGTAALEGRANDCHAGFCTGGACASFQTRVALILAIALAAGAMTRDMKELADEFFAIDERYHGRREILEYTLQCCLQPATDVGSYRKFMSGRAGISPIMEPMLHDGSTGMPGDPYFIKLQQKLSEDELRAFQKTVITESPIPDMEESMYPVIPYEPELQCPMSVQTLADHLCYGPRQPEALKALGFSATSTSTIDLTFKESGRAYADPDGDREQLESKISEQRFRLSMKRDREAGELSMRIRLGGWEQDGVNFLGNIEVDVGRKCYVLPLTGRGTAALEGREKDAHAGFCTGPGCAAFQIRAALCLAVARAIGASDDDLESLGRELHAINARYHGRDAILDYTIHCALNPDAESYLSFMSVRYGGEEQRYPLLQAMRSEGKPHRGYFDALKKKFSQEELDRARRREAGSFEVESDSWWSWLCCPGFLTFRRK